jgi:uncharacterized protein (DUF58 family)
MTIPHAGAMAPERVLRRLELVITRRLDGLLQGDHLGLLPGPGSELAEAREYRPAEDDVRRMDWNVTARTTIPHVRDLVADHELETWVLVDASASMDFGTAQMEKRDLAVAAVATVGFLTARAGNRIGALVAGNGALLPIPARTGRGHLLMLLRTLLATPRPAARQDEVSLAAALDAMHRSVRRRGLVVVASDFLDGLDGLRDPEWERPLRRLATRQQVLAVETVDPRELELPDVGLLSVVDPETGRTREVPTASRRLRDRYAAAASRQRAGVAAALRRAGATQLQLRTDRDWVRDVVRHVVLQRRLARAAPLSRYGRPPGGAP